MLEAMKEYPQWIVWAQKEGRKLPLDPRTLKAASTTNPKTWASFEMANDVLQENKNVEGLGFVFSENDPFVGVDIDKCIDADGVFNEIAQEVIEKMIGTYIEYSPSGKGLHVLGLGSIPDWAHNKDDSLGLEIYSRGRFFTMTFEPIPDCNDEVAEIQESLYLVCSKHLMKQRSKKRASKKQQAEIPVLSEGERDEGIFEIARSIFHKGLSKWQAYALVREVARNCKPPFDEATAEQKVDSAWKTEDVHPGEVVEHMNEKIGMVNAGGSVVYAMESPERGQGLRFLNKDGLKDLYRNTRVRYEDAGGNVKHTDWFSYWLSSPERHTYNALTFRPAKEVAKDQLNLWRGYAMDTTTLPRKNNLQRCRGILDHIWKNIAQERQEWYDYIVDWLASVVRWPDTGPQTALVFRGQQGTGKGVVGQYMDRIFGAHYIVVSQPDHFVGRFNAHLADKVLVFADEAIWGGDKKAEGELKHMITDPRRTVEIKGKDAFQIDNKIHLMVASNEDWVVPVGLTDRRFAIFDTRTQNELDHEVLAQAWDELSTTGPEALFGYLYYEREMCHKPAMFNMPFTSAKRFQKVQGLDKVARVWVDWIENGAPPDYAEWPAAMSTKMAYELFQRELRESGKHHVPSQTEFTMKTLEFFGPTLIEKKRTRNVPQAAEEFTGRTREHFHDEESKPTAHPRQVFLLSSREEFINFLRGMGL